MSSLCSSAPEDPNAHLYKEGFIEKGCNFQPGEYSSGPGQDLNVTPEGNFTMITSLFPGYSNIVTGKWYAAKDQLHLMFAGTARSERGNEEEHFDVHGYKVFTIGADGCSLRMGGGEWTKKIAMEEVAERSSRGETLPAKETYPKGYIDVADSFTTGRYTAGPGTELDVRQGGDFILVDKLTNDVMEPQTVTGTWHTVADILYLLINQAIEGAHTPQESTIPTAGAKLLRIQDNKTLLLDGVSWALHGAEECT